MASTARALQHTMAARADVEMALLEERLELLSSQRCLAAMRCQQFTDMMEQTLCATEHRIEPQGNAHSPGGVQAAGTPRAVGAAAGTSTISRRASLNSSRSSRRASFDGNVNRETARYYGVSSKGAHADRDTPTTGGAPTTRVAHHHRPGRRGSLDIQREAHPQAHRAYPRAASVEERVQAHPQAQQLFQFKGMGKASGGPQAGQAATQRGEQLFEYALLAQGRGGATATPAQVPAQAQPAACQAAAGEQPAAYRGSESESEGDTSAPSDEEDFLRSSQRQALPAAHRRASMDLAGAAHGHARSAFPRSASAQHPPVGYSQACFVPAVQQPLQLQPHHRHQTQPQHQPQPRFLHQYQQQLQQHLLRGAKGCRAQGAEGSATEDAETSEASDAGEFLRLRQVQAGRRHTVTVSSQRTHQGTPQGGSRMGPLPSRQCPVMATALAAVSPEGSSSDSESDTDSEGGPRAYPVALGRRGSLEAQWGCASRLVADDFLTAWETPRAQWRRSSRQIKGQ